MKDIYQPAEDSHLLSNVLKKEIPKLLEKMQTELYETAKKSLENAKTKTENKKELIKLIQKQKIVMVPMCKNPTCEDHLKAETSGGKTLFIDPENNPVKNKKCIICNKQADYWVYCGKTY